MNGHLLKSEYRVGLVSQATCEALYAAHHYARGCSKQATFRHGLYRVDSSECIGIAHWIPPMRWAAWAAWPTNFREVVCLSRLVLVPGLPTNAASFLIGQSVRLIRQDGRFRCLLTYADTQQGHTGGIYRATNWEYLGLTDSKPAYVDGEGRLTARERGGKTRTRKEMEAAGCQFVGFYPKHKFRLILPETKRPTPRGQALLFETSA